MFISSLELFKVGIGPSSSHTMGPMVAAYQFRTLIKDYLSNHHTNKKLSVECVLKGSLAFTGRGHATDRAVVIGLHGYLPEDVAKLEMDVIIKALWQQQTLAINEQYAVHFKPDQDIIFDKCRDSLEHPNEMHFELLDASGNTLVGEIYFSIGGGFVCTRDEIKSLSAPLKMQPMNAYPHAFDSAKRMLEMSEASQLSIAEMKRLNELTVLSSQELDQGLDSIWQAMKCCLENGLKSGGVLPGGLQLRRRAKNLHQQLLDEPKQATVNDWLCAYAMAVNEENAAGHMVVTAPTNGAAGVVPAVLYYLVIHEGITDTQIYDFLLTAAAIGGLIKYRGSISGAEVGCQGEVGSASSMAAAGMCAVRGGSSRQIEKAAEIALEHHLGMTCDPVNGLVQVPCIERNGFGAIKAFTAASLALREGGDHFMPLDNCIAAMKQTGLEMSKKYKETSLGGLAVSITEC
ncbi:L-serine ammonia-lyase [Pseudomonadota bacterium]